MVGRRARVAGLGTGLVAGIFAANATFAQSDERIVIHGLQDVELFQTDADSLLLSKNDGELAAAGRLRLWVAADLAPKLTMVVLGGVEGGKGTADGTSSAAIEQAFLRFIAPGKVGVTVQGGKIISPFGNFNPRYFSNLNPLIGAPDGYDVSYPRGAVAALKVARVELKAAVIDRPLVNPKYVPESDPALRPGLEVGVTPMTGLRLAAYYTQGPYLGDGVTPMLPVGEGWRDFDQQVAGFDLSFSRGYFELNGEATWSSYEVPTIADAATGTAWFLEPKYTWTPRFFTALRVERNDYPYIAPIAPSFWIAPNAAFYDAELGVGWRATPDLILKASYRRDRWNPSPDPTFPFPNGYAIGLQLSYSFDVKSWTQPR